MRCNTPQRVEATAHKTHQQLLVVLTHVLLNPHHLLERRLLAHPAHRAQVAQRHLVVKRAGIEHL